MIVLLVVALCSAGLMWLSADFSVRSFFGRSDPEAQYLDAYLERWGEDDMLVLIVDGGEAGLLSRARLEAMDRLASEIDAVEGVSKVVSLTRQSRVNRIAGMWLPVPLLSTVPASDDSPRMSVWREELMRDPHLVPAFLSRDGRHGTILAALDVDASDLRAVRPLVEQIQALVARHDDEGLRYQVAGVPAIRADILDVIVGDQILFVPIAAGAMGLLLFVMFRSRHGVLIPGIAAGLPTVMLLGIMGWTGEDFNLLNQSFLALVPAISVANAIHLVSRYHEEGRALSHDGRVLTLEQQSKAIVDASQHIGMACFLTTFTTVIGFLALLQTDLPVLRGYGVYSAVGVVISYVTLLTVVPLLLTTTRRSARRVEHGSEGVLGGVLELAADVTTRTPWRPLIFAAIVVVLAGWAGTWVTVDTRLTRTYNEDHPVTMANRILDDSLGGVMALEWDLQAAPGTFARSDVLAAMARVEQGAMAEVPAVRSTVCAATLLRGASALMGGPDAVPDDPEVVRKLYRVLQDAGALSSFVSPERDRARLVIRTTDVGAHDFLALGEQLQRRVDGELGAYGVQAHLTGSSFVTYRGLSRVTSDLRSSLMTSFGVIGVVIALLFWDLWLGLLSLIPNTLPQIFGYGVMGAFGWTLEPAPAVVYTIAVGVSVDSAIHIISRFNEERSVGASVDEAVRVAIYSSGRAVMITELMLSFGFLVNVFSSSPANASFGKLGSVIILLGPPSNLFVLPALLKLGLGGRHPRA